MDSPIQLFLEDLSATRRFAERIAANIRVPVTIALSGPLGAGKTQWCRDFCVACGVAAETITSPTYILLQLYRGQTHDIYHFDFYRLENEEQVWDLGFDEIREQPAVILVEWADKFPETLPADYLAVQFILSGQEQHRQVELKATGPLSRALIETSGLASFHLSPKDKQ